MKVIQNNANVAEIESRLNKYSYLSKNTLPGFPDAKVFTILEASKRFPDRKINPNFYHWYIIMKQFAPSTIRKWIADELYLDHEDSLIQEFVKLYQNKVDTQPEAAQSHSPEGLNPKLENHSLIQHTIEITLKDITADKMNSLRKILEEYKAEMSEQEINNSKLFRILCRIDPLKLDEFDRKISKCIEYDGFFVKRKDMKGQKTAQQPIGTQEKND